MELLSANDWNLFKDAIRDVTDTFMRKPVDYIKESASLDRFGEERQDRFEDAVTLEALVEYKGKDGTTTPAGLVTREYVTLTFDLRTLAEAGVVTNGVCDINEETSIFVVEGLRYRVLSAMPDAQARDENLLFIVTAQIDPIP
jgi:hypothetical protein